MYTVPDRIIYRRTDTNAIIYDTTVAGEYNNPAFYAGDNAALQTRSIGLVCIYKTESYDTIKAEILGYENDVGFWNYKVIAKPNDLLTNIYVDYLTSTSTVTYGGSQTWTTDWVVPVTYTRKIRVKFQPNHPSATIPEPDRLVLTSLIRGGTTSTSLDTGPSILTTTQDLLLANNVTGVRIQITTDTSDINDTQYKWIFGVSNSGVNPF
jgi:hypothetical protein